MAFPLKPHLSHIVHPPQRRMWTTKRVNLARKGRGGRSLAALADRVHPIVALYTPVPDLALRGYLAVDVFRNGRVLYAQACAMHCDVAQRPLVIPTWRWTVDQLATVWRRLRQCCLTHSEVVVGVCQSHHTSLLCQ